jgi:hypothetical protein
MSNKARKQIDAEARDEASDTIHYAAERGIVFTHQAVVGLLRRRGIDNARGYIDDLEKIMDKACTSNVDCTQAQAIRRLTLAGGDAQRVVADLAAHERRRADRRTAKCGVIAPPRELGARTNAFAGCSCPRCCERLAAHMPRYIGKLIAKPYFAYLDRDEARAEANLELIQSIETWPGGNFTGWFAARFYTRVKEIYRSRPVEQDDMCSLDAASVLAYDDGGRIVSLGERVPDRSVDVLRIVIWREQRAEAALKKHRECVERAREYESQAASRTPASARAHLRLVASNDLTPSHPSGPAQARRDAA